MTGLFYLAVVAMWAILSLCLHHGIHIVKLHCQNGVTHFQSARLLLAGVILLTGIAFNYSMYQVYTVHQQLTHLSLVR